jgi:hypothetical protein
LDSGFNVDLLRVSSVVVMRLARELWYDLAASYKTDGIQYIHAVADSRLPEPPACAIAVLRVLALETSFASTVLRGSKKQDIIRGASHNPSRAPERF